MNWTGFVKDGFVKHEFVKHGFVKGIRKSKQNQTIFLFHSYTSLLPGFYNPL